MFVQAVTSDVSHSAFRCISRSLHKVSETALKAVLQEQVVRQELKASGYFVRVEANAQLRQIVERSLMESSYSFFRNSHSL